MPFMKNNNTMRLQVVITIGAIFFVFAFNISAVSQVGWAQNIGSNSSLSVYSSDSRPYGLSYGDWTAKWWAWLVSIPTNINPASDTTGSNCAQTQAGPVWFLAGSVAGHAERTCTIPTGKAVFFPILGAECSYAEYPKLKTESDLRSCAVALNNQRTVQAVIDGVSLQSQQMPRIQSPLFSVTFPETNIFGASAGPSQSLADGYYVFLQHLSPGKHEISFKAVSVQFTTTGVQSVAQNIVYHLTVQ
jgi:hypothetical protein